MNTNKPELMRQIADAMEKEPEGWWRGFDIMHEEFAIAREPLSARDLLEAFAKTDIRPRPRTITINVEVPEPMRERPMWGQRYWVLDGMNESGIQGYTWDDLPADQRLFTQGIWPTQQEAQQAADAIFGALGRKDD